MQLIYFGMLGVESCELISYLEAVPGVVPIGPGENPATWMLEVTGGTAITGRSKAAGLDFADYYRVCRTHYPCLIFCLCISLCLS